MSSALGIGLLAGAGLCAIAVAIAHSLVADEIRAWLPYLARRLVASAAQRLPADARTRFENDWLAELAAWEDRPLSGLAKAGHIRWKARAIQESLGGSTVSRDRLKRVFDFGSAMALLVLLAPLMLLIAIAIKVESRGPVFFGAPRAGRGNTSFRLIKFRSMYVDAETRLQEHDGSQAREAMFRIRDDPRVTRVGHFIRRYSVDELPQLFNVLRGDMSLVGPRPLIFPELDGLEEIGYLQRFEVRPGLTGPWQLNSRSTYNFEEMNRLDTEYVRSRSLLLDLRLLLRTMLSPFFSVQCPGHGADHKPKDPPDRSSAER